MNISLYVENNFGVKSVNIILYEGNFPLKNQPLSTISVNRELEELMRDKSFKLTGYTTMKYYRNGRGENPYIVLIPHTRIDTGTNIKDITDVIEKKS